MPPCTDHSAHRANQWFIRTYLTIDRPDSALRKLYSLCNTRELEKRLKAVHLRLDPVTRTQPHTHTHSLPTRSVRFSKVSHYMT